MKNHSIRLRLKILCSSITMGIAAIVSALIFLKYHFLISEKTGLNPNVIIKPWMSLMLVFLLMFIMIQTIYSMVLLKRLNVNHANKLGECKDSYRHEIMTRVIDEVANPVSAILEKVHYLNKQISGGKYATPEKIQERLLTIEHALEKLNKKTQNFDQKPLKIEVENSTSVYSLKSIFENALSDCAIRIKESEINILLSDVPQIHLNCNPLEISLVLGNLLNNACDAVSGLSERWIKIEILKLGQVLKISVVDSGKGIPNKIANKIMQPFFTTKDRLKANGLGLSSSKKILENHGGKLYLDEDSQNTSFVIELNLNHQIPTKENSGLAVQKRAA